MLQSFAKFKLADYIHLAYKALVYTHQVNPAIAEYISKFSIALNKCSDITDIEAKYLFEENL